MANERRNPYVILGVPFGATAEEARSGFAKASRRIRTEQGAMYSMEDLTWALHQVEQIIEDPSKALHVYRIPADPHATLTARPGVFRPEPERIQRQSPPSTVEDWEAVRLQAARALLKDALTATPLTLNLPEPYEARS